MREIKISISISSELVNVRALKTCHPADKILKFQIVKYEKGKSFPCTFDENFFSRGASAPATSLKMTFLGSFELRKIKSAIFQSKNGVASSLTVQR